MLGRHSSGITRVPLSPPTSWLLSLASFKLLYVFLILELGSRRLLHSNVTAHPTAEWTLQQVREAMPNESRHRFLIHDRDAIFSADFDDVLSEGFELRVLHTPPKSPKANAFVNGWLAQSDESALISSFR